MAESLMTPVDGTKNDLRLQKDCCEDSDDDIIEIIDHQITQTEQSETFFVCFWCDCQFSVEELCRQHIESCHSPSGDGVQELASHEEPVSRPSTPTKGQDSTEIVSVHEQSETLLHTVEDDAMTPLFAEANHMNSKTELLQPNADVDKSFLSISSKHITCTQTDFQALRGQNSLLRSALNNTSSGNVDRADVTSKSPIPSANAQMLPAILYSSDDLTADDNTDVAAGQVRSLTATPESVSNSETVILQAEHRLAPELHQINGNRSSVSDDSVAPQFFLTSSTIMHKKQAILPKRLKCTICDARFCHLKTLENHVSAQHNPKKGSLEYYTSLYLFVCDICKDSFSTKESLSEHMKVYHNQEHDSSAEFPCLTCDSSFDTFVDLKSHIADKKHELEWFCFTCEQLFPEESALRIHFCSRTSSETSRIVHPMFFCSICSKSFHGAKVFAKHMNHCTFSEYCARCAKHCHSLKDVLEHTKDCGRGTTSYFCSFCDLFTRSVVADNRLEKTKILLKRVHCRCCGKCFAEINTEFIQHEAKCEVNNRYESTAASSVLLPSSKASWADKCSSCFMLKKTMNSVNKLAKSEVLLKRMHCSFCGKCFVEKCPKFVAHENRCKWAQKCTSCKIAELNVTLGSSTDRRKLLSERVHCKCCGKCFYKKCVEFFKHELNCKYDCLDDQLNQSSILLPPSYASWKEKCKSCQVFMLTITATNKLERTKVLMKRVHCKFCGKCFNESSLDFFRHESKCKVGGLVKLLPNIEHKPKETTVQNCGVVPVSKFVDTLENVGHTLAAVVHSSVNEPECADPLNTIKTNANTSSNCRSLLRIASVDADNPSKGGKIALPVISNINNFVPVISDVSQALAPTATGQIPQAVVKTIPANHTNVAPPCSLVASQDSRCFPIVSPETQFLLITNADGSQILLPLAANLTSQLTQRVTTVTTETTTHLTPKAAQTAAVTSAETNLAIAAPISSVETLPVLAISKQHSSSTEKLLEVSMRVSGKNQRVKVKSTIAVAGGKTPKERLSSQPADKIKTLSQTKPQTEILKTVDDKAGKRSSSYKRLKEKYVEERRAKRMTVSANLHSVWRCALCTITTVAALGEACKRCKTLYRLARSEQYKKAKSQQSLWFSCISCSVGCVPVKGGRCGACMKKLFTYHLAELPHTRQTHERPVIVSEVPLPDNMNFKTYLSSAIDEALTDEDDSNVVSNQRFLWCSKCGHCYLDAQFTLHPCKSLRRRMQSCYVVIETLGSDFSSCDFLDTSKRHTFVNTIHQENMRTATGEQKKSAHSNTLHVGPIQSFEPHQFSTLPEKPKSITVSNTQTQGNQTSSSIQQLEFLPFVTEINHEIPPSEIDSSKCNTAESIEQLQKRPTLKFKPMSKSKTKVRPLYLPLLPPQSPEFTQFVNNFTSEVPKIAKVSKNKTASVTGSHKLDQFIGDLAEIVPTHYCSECNSTFDSEKLYTWHLRTHDEYRPFPCSYCGCRFRRLSNLHEHIRFYHLRGQVPCYKCGKRFANSLLLRKHNKSHTGHYQFKRRIVDPLRPSFELKKWKRNNDTLTTPSVMPTYQINGYSPTPTNAEGEFLWPSDRENLEPSETDDHSSVQGQYGSAEIVDVQPNTEAISSTHLSADTEQSDSLEQTSTSLEDANTPNEDSNNTEHSDPMNVDILEVIIDG